MTPESLAASRVPFLWRATQRSTTNSRTPCGCAWVKASRPLSPPRPPWLRAYLHATFGGWCVGREVAPPRISCQHTRALAWVFQESRSVLLLAWHFAPPARVYQTSFRKHVGAPRHHSRKATTRRPRKFACRWVPKKSRPNPRGRMRSSLSAVLALGLPRRRGSRNRKCSLVLEQRTMVWHPHPRGENNPHASRFLLPTLRRCPPPPILTGKDPGVPAS
jgi:hypothetical protein